MLLRQEYHGELCRLMLYLIAGLSDTTEIVVEDCGDILVLVALFHEQQTSMSLDRIVKEDDDNDCDSFEAHYSVGRVFCRVLESPLVPFSGNDSDKRG